MTCTYIYICITYNLYVCTYIYTYMCISCMAGASFSELSSSSLQHTATHCNTLQHTTTHCNTLQHTGIAGALLSHLHSRRVIIRVIINLIATHCNTLQHTATHLHSRRVNSRVIIIVIATHCNTLQHTCIAGASLSELSSSSLSSSNAAIRNPPPAPPVSFLFATSRDPVFGRRTWRRGKMRNTNFPGYRFQKKS